MGRGLDSRAPLGPASASPRPRVRSPLLPANLRLPTPPHRPAKQEMDGRRILIFCETKKGCDAVTRQLRMDGWPALSIHGDKSQHERDWVLAEFKAGEWRRGGGSGAAAGPAPSPRANIPALL